jgi:uncharacterized membrane protein
MPSLLYQSLLFLHLLAAVIWVGGMFFAHFALRPSVAEVLQPPQRIPLMTATLGRFFRVVSLAIVVIVLTGFAMFARAGFASAPIGWHLMLGLGILMAVLFTYIYAVPYQQLRRRSQAGAWPDAASALGIIRHLVAFNLFLGACAIASAAFARG